MIDNFLKITVTYCVLIFFAQPLRLTKIRKTHEVPN